MFNIGENYDKLWRAIIRPPRAEYTLHDLGKKVDEIGPQVFKKNNVKIKRTDIQLQNQRGLKLQCSHY